LAEVNTRVVFCDDIRQEHNGKLILIGAYAGEIRFLAPFIQPIATWIQIFGLSTGPHKATVTVAYEDNDNSALLGTIEMQFQITDETIPAHGFPTGLMINFDRPGYIVVNIAIDDQPPIVADRLKITFSDNS